MAIDIGRIAHTAYRNCDGKLVKDIRWEDLGKAEQDAWRHAACAVLDYIDQAKQDMEDDVIG